MSISCDALTFTLAPATATLLLNLTPSRKLLMLENTGGSNPATFKFKTAPVSATDGFTLDPASTSAGQGGTLMLKDSVCPVDALYAYSTLGTTVTIVHGNPYA